MAKKDKSGKKEESKEQADKYVPEVNIGIVGHVDHGKTTLTSTLTGKFTDQHSEELKRGITIRLGYADLQIRKCPKCERNLAYSKFEKCFHCNSDTELLRTISFVDVPGHETLMATVLTGASLMDGALLVIAANEPCPQPQTGEHLEALNISGIKNIIIVQNKIDLVTEEQALKSYNEIKAFVKGSIAENAPIIPISAIHRANIGTLLEAIEDFIKTPKRDLAKPPKMFVTRSFDVNKPGTPIQQLVGGVIGGGLIEGVLSVGDEIEIRPGIAQKEIWTPLYTKIASIHHGNKNTKTGSPGGLLSIGTALDPYITKSDNLAGSIVGYKDKLQKMLDTIKIEIHLMKRVVGVKLEEIETKPILKGDILLINKESQRTVGVCIQPGNIATIKLKKPICADAGEKIAISRQVNSRWRLIGYGILK